MKILMRDPNVGFSVHPAVKAIPVLTDEEMLPIRAGMKYGGEMIQPLLIDDQGRLLSDTSRTHWLCAKARQLKEVPVCICAAGDVHLILIRDLAHRRHLSKSAIAYLAVPNLQPALDAARMRQLENLRKSPENAEAYSVGFEAKTLHELARELGISDYMLDMAIKVRKEFEDKKTYTFNVAGGAKDGACVESTLKDWYEPKILQAYVGGEHEQNRPMGLGGIIAGITAVKEGDKSKFAPKMSQGDFFADLFTRDLQKFNKLTDSRRSAALAVIEKSAAELPPEECDAAADTMFEMGRIYRDAANKAKAEPRHGKGASRIGETK